MDKPFAIFDMDGTLVDSMVYWTHLATEFLESKGVQDISPGIFYCADIIMKIISHAESLKNAVSNFIKISYLKLG